MKVNLHTNKKHEKGTLKWLERVAMDFFEEYDITLSTSAWLWFKTPDGCKYFVDWLRAKGWQAEYWELPMFEDPSKNNQLRHIGFGIEFVDNCPRFVEALLKG